MKALLKDEPLTGHWFNRSREYAARNQRQAFEPLRYATEEAVTFSPIPCWAHLSPELYRTRIAGLVQSIETAAAEGRKRTGRPVRGVKEILERDLQHRPAKLSRSPAPLVHAATEATEMPRKEFYGMYSWFVAAFQDAAKMLRLGDHTACFPAGSFPPALPFVSG